MTLTTIAGARGPLPLPDLCWVPMPNNPSRRCTHPDRRHDGDHRHEYSGASWPRYKGEQLAREQDT